MTGGRGDLNVRVLTRCSCVLFCLFLFSSEAVDLAVKCAGKEVAGRQIRVDYAPVRERKSFGGNDGGSRGGTYPTLIMILTAIVLALPVADAFSF